MPEISVKKRSTVTDTNKIRQKAFEGYTQMNAPRDPADFGGHEYAYRCGVAKELFRQILKELQVNILEEIQK